MKLKFVIFMLVAFLLSSVFADFREVERVKRGEANLSCLFNDGWRKVDSDKVVDNFEGRWVFTNGSAINCKVTGN